MVRLKLATHSAMVMEIRRYAKANCSVNAAMRMNRIIADERAAEPHDSSVIVPMNRQ